jgi:hypothetical protein
LLPEKEFGCEAFDNYGYRCIASLCIDKCKDVNIEIIWDMPCVFAAKGHESKILSPLEVMDIVEYDNDTIKRKYTLAHMLCLIIEVAPLFSEFKTKYTHDTAFRICNDPKCCNPYHRSVPNTNLSNITFISRLNLFMESFNKQLKYAYSKRENASDDGKQSKKQKCISGTNVIPTRLFIGTFYSDKKKIDRLDVENRVHFDGNVRMCTNERDEIEIECVTGANKHIAWVPLRTAIESVVYPGYIDIIKSIQTVGGNSKLLKMCLNLKNIHEVIL